MYPVAAPLPMAKAVLPVRYRNSSGVVIAPRSYAISSEARTPSFMAIAPANAPATAPGPLGDEAAAPATPPATVVGRSPSDWPMAMATRCPKSSEPVGCTVGLPKNSPVVECWYPDNKALLTEDTG